MSRGEVTRWGDSNQKNSKIYLPLMYHPDDIKYSLGLRVHFNMKMNDHTTLIFDIKL